MSEFRRAEAMDPLSPAIVGQIGIVAHQQGEFDLALDSFRKSLELEPGFYFAQIWRSRLY
jgi:lipoprotein NlpI